LGRKLNVQRRGHVYNAERSGMFTMLYVKAL
jgi:hypothetical protein